MLEKNKNNLKSVKAYEKSKTAVDSIIKIIATSNSKIDLITECLICRCGDITPLALQKGLYYIQGFYYAFYNEFIFSEDCEAWVHGPVYREIYNRYSNYKFNPINGDKEFDDSSFSSSEKAIVESVAKNLCCYSGKILEKFTHSELPWLITRGDLAFNVPSNKVIEKSMISKYFEDVKNKYNMINANDIKSYAQKMFEQL